MLMVMAVLGGFIPRAQVVTDPHALYIAIGIIGATVMPHNLYLHSSIVQTRAYPRTDEGRRSALRWAVTDSTIALTLALFINASILILAAAVFQAEKDAWDQAENGRALGAKLVKLEKKTTALKIGNPLDEATDIGTIINNKQFTKVCKYVQDGLDRADAKLVFGGLPPRSGPLSEGYFAVPTVFADRSNDWRLAREEIFGPVLVAIRWSDEAEVIRMANDSHYGLAAYVWTHDIGTGLRTAHAIESGWVQVNQGLGQVPGMSYGGYKQSGIGREFSLEGMLDSFTQRKNVTVNLAV